MNSATTHEPFSFVHITDHHLLRTDRSLLRGFSTGWAFRRTLRHLAEQVGSQIDFIVSTGDLVHYGTEEEYENLKRMLHLELGSAAPGPLPASTRDLEQVPMYFLPGNHDSRYNLYRCLFPDSQPAELMNVTFEHKGIQFVCLDWGPRTKAIAAPETLAFLAAALESGKPTILLMHHQVVPLGYPTLDEFIADEIDKFWEIVWGKPVLAMLAGHVHRNYHTNVGPVQVLGTASTSFQFGFEQDHLLFCLRPLAYRLVTVQGGRVTTRVFDVPL